MTMKRSSHVIFNSVVHSDVKCAASDIQKIELASKSISLHEAPCLVLSSLQVVWNSHWWFRHNCMRISETCCFCPAVVRSSTQTPSVLMWPDHPMISFSGTPLVNRWDIPVALRIWFDLSTASTLYTSSNEHILQHGRQSVMAKLHLLIPSLTTFNDWSRQLRNSKDIYFSPGTAHE